MKGPVMKRRSYILLSLTIAAIGIGCFNNPVTPVITDAQKEFNFCWGFLRTMFIYQERLPQNPDIYTDPAALFASVNDRYTHYFEPPQALQLRAALTSQTTGIGVVLDSVANGYAVQHVAAGSPASEAGVKQDDTILTVNDHPLAGIGFDEADEWLTFEVGDVARLHIKRNDTTIDLSAIAATYLAPSVYTDSLDSATAYIMLTMFSAETPHPQGSAGEFHNALVATAWARNTVLDLSRNGGGLLEQCFTIIEEFLPANTPIIKIRYRTTHTDNGPMVTDTNTLMSEKTGLAANRSFYVLVSGSTASASEILVSCLKEQRHATVTIIGETTYGKGSGWSMEDTPQEGIVTATSALFDPLTMVSYNHVGIVPDILVQPGEDPLTVALNQISGGTVAKAGRRTDRMRIVAAQRWPRQWLPVLIVD
jgi:carboxyl-terminal processing protease